MQIHLLPHVDGNFGDALNEWLWRDLLPEVFDDRADGVRFVGIGTILDRHLPRAPLTVIFGTGTGYAAPPEDLHGGRFRIYGVRGPLTARTVGVAEHGVLGDPAILLATHPAFGARRAPRGVVFVPHWKSVRFGQWRQACALAGIDFVDPRGDAHEVIARIAGARKVIAESMHAGIVADAFRVPWRPVVLSREVAPFKWADWAATLGLAYEPVAIGPSSPVERWRDRLLRHSAFAYIDALERPGVPLRWSDDALMKGRETAAARIGNPLHLKASSVAEALLKRVARAAPHTHARLAPGLYDACLERAAEQLYTLALAEFHLSSDAAHDAALGRCREALQRLHDDHRAGRLQAHAARARLHSSLDRSRR